MTDFLDTSVLVPVFLAEHPHHQVSLRLFAQCDRDSANCAAHSLVEVYSTLTRLPLPHRATPEEAILFIDDVLKRLTPITLEPGEHVRTLHDAAALGVSGGAVYDYLISRCALKAGADTLYTWNLRHYNQFGENVAKTVRNPDAASE